VGDPGFDSQLGNLSFLAGIFQGFPQCNQLNPGVVLKCVMELSLLRHSQQSFQTSAENKMEDLPLGLKYSDVLHLRISATKTKKPCYNDIGLGLPCPLRKIFCGNN